MDGPAAEGGAAALARAFLAKAVLKVESTRGLVESTRGLVERLRNEPTLRLPTFPSNRSAHLSSIDPNHSLSPPLSSLQTCQTRTRIRPADQPRILDSLPVCH